MANFLTPWVAGVTRFSAAVMNVALDALDKAITYNRPAIVSCDGDVTWDSTTGTLAWSGPLRIIFNRTDGVAILNTVNAGSVVLADNQFAKVTLNELNDSVITVTAVTAGPGSASNFLDSMVRVLAYRNATSDVLVSIGLGDLLAKGDSSALDGRVVDLETEVQAARGVEASLDARLDAMDEAISSTGGFADQVANTIFAGPASGADDQPTFRALVDDDLDGISFSISMYFPDTYENGQVLYSSIPKIPFDIASGTGTITADLTDGANPTATAVVSIKKNGTEWASVSIATNGTPTVTNTAGVSFNGSTDRMTILAPSTADTTLEGLSINFLATRT